MRMATSRTGTAQWKATARYVRREAQAQGLTHCPSCGCLLDWDQGLRPNSAEVDHIVPASKGGSDGPENARVLCRYCNQSRGNRDAPTPKNVQLIAPLRVSRVH